jgi:Domain of unknown function (DUF5658)
MPGMVMSPGSVRRLAYSASLTVLFAAFGAEDARAQDINSPTLLTSHLLSTTAIAAIDPPMAPEFALRLEPLTMLEDEVTSSTGPSTRPAALFPLYVSFVSLQALDVISTRHALAWGGREANPALRSFAHSTTALVAMKAGSTVAIIYFTERLRKRHPVAAVLLMVGLNAGYAGVAAHNYSVRGK